MKISFIFILFSLVILLSLIPSSVKAQSCGGDLLYSFTDCIPLGAWAEQCGQGYGYAGSCSANNGSGSCSQTEIRNERYDCYDAGGICSVGALIGERILPFSSGECYEITGGPGGGDPPSGNPPPPTYDITGYVFKDFNKDSSKATSDTGVPGIPIAILSWTEITDNAGYYNQYDFYEGNYTVTAGGSVCGWYYKDNSVPVALFGGNKNNVNFPLWPNDPGNLQLQAFTLRDINGSQRTIYDPGEDIYAYTSTANNGTSQPYSKYDVVQGAIHMDVNNQTAVTSTMGVVTASYPDYFYWERNLCWNGGGINYQTGSYPTGNNVSHWLNVKKYSTTTPGAYIARANVDYLNRVDEGGTTALEYTDNQLWVDYNIRNYTVQGNVFLDTNGDGNKDPLENNYTGALGAITEADIAVANPNASGTYSIGSRTTGSKIWRINPPSGYIITGPSSYTINFSNGTYTVSPNTNSVSPAYPQGPVSPGGAVTNTSTTIANVNFGISQSNSWVQAYGLSARFDRGLPMANIPVTADASYGRFAMKPASTSATPGILVTGSENITLPVSSTNYNYKIGGTTFPEIFNSRLFPLKTSYTYLISKLGGQAVELSAAPGGCPDYANCTLDPALFRPGIYKVTNATLRLNPYSFVRQSGEAANPANKDYIFLIDGSLAVKGPGPTRVDNNRTLLFSAKGDIAIDVRVGRAPTSYTSPTDLSKQKASDLSGIEGFYVAEDDIRLNSRGPCPQTTADVQLFVDGALIANANNGDGFIDNQRSLCATNNIYPTLIVRPRPDLILTVPSVYKQNPFIWREVAP